MEQIPMGQAPVTKTLIPVSNSRFAEAIYFNRPEKQVICMSTQLSCSVGCAFCASPGPEKTVNLSSDEILRQIDTMFDTHGSQEKIMLFSFMGEGEPLLNYQNVIETMHALPKKYPNCRISVSTSGVKPSKIESLAYEEFGVPFKLQVSMHSLDPEVRKWLIPEAKSVEDIKDAIEFYHLQQPTRPVELNFALMAGVNDRLEDAERIVETFPTEYIKISKYNHIPGKPYAESDPLTVQWFVAYLRAKGLTVEYHQTDGEKVGAACGQTRGIAEAEPCSQDSH